MTAQGPGYPPVLQDPADADRIGTQFSHLAVAAKQMGQTHLGYLESRHFWRPRWRRSEKAARSPGCCMRARLPFEFERSGVSAARLRELAEGGYVTKAEPVLLVGEAGTGKTHLATGLCLAACRQRRRVDFTTPMALNQRVGRGGDRQPARPRTGPMGAA